MNAPIASLPLLPLFEAAAVLVGAIAAHGAGLRLGHQSTRWSLGGYCLSITLLLAVAAGFAYRPLEFVPPFAWLMAGRVEFPILALATALLAGTLAARVPRPRERLGLGVLTLLAACKIAVWPFAAPAFNQGQLLALPTTFDVDAVCRQGTDYTCGPAAAVTCLRRLGLSASEGQIAIRCRTTAATGTAGDELATALNREFGSAGVTARHRRFTELGELATALPTAAQMRFDWLLDHWVAVLAVTDETVLVGDPLAGLQTLPRGEFEARWRFVGDTLTREGCPGSERE